MQQLAKDLTRLDCAPSPGTFSCVVDEHPRFHLEALRWFASLTTLAGADPSDLVINVVGTDSDVLTHLRAEGVVVRGIHPFDPRSAHCNKIAGARRLAEDGVEGLAVLCDSDIAVISDPRCIEVPPFGVAAKPPDAPLPPVDVLTDVFKASGLPVPSTLPLPWGKEEPAPQLTLAGNSNGGLYLVPGSLLPTVARAWEHWARWLLDRVELMANWTMHVDQVAMALGLAAEGIEPVALDVRWNTPTHDLTRIPPDAQEPSVIHYHQALYADGRIRLTGNPSIDRRIENVNAAIVDVWQRAFPDVTFWEWRYLTDPDLGSGVGSRGRPLDDKRLLLATLLEALAPDSVLDVGCGDGEATRDLPIRNYTGVDVSAEAVRRASSGRPEGKFLVGTLARHPVHADLTLCLDVLIHQSDVAAYREQVALAWRSARVALVISGYEGPVRAKSAMVHFHEPLSETLRSVAPAAEVYPVRREHHITTFVVLRAPTDPHPRDYGSTTLSPLMKNHPDPLGLLLLRLHARRTVGFYPNHAPRLFEYPVVAALLEGLLEPGSRIVDVGAGITPLPPFLLSRGYFVETVDSSPVRRTWPPGHDWNEWDFLDYGQAGLAHRSWNSTFGELPLTPPFDAAYSISVVEHLPARERRSLLRDMSSRLRPDGVAVLTIDLVRDSDDLWNRSRGVEVEKPSRHGTLYDVVSEGRRVGLDTFRCETVRRWGDTPVDIGLLAMRRASHDGEVLRPLLQRWRRARRSLPRAEP